MIEIKITLLSKTTEHELANLKAAITAIFELAAIRFDYFQYEIKEQNDVEQNNQND